MQYAACSEKGTERDSNQDNYFEKNLKDLTIFAVADGVGGLAFGDIASKLAIKPFSQVISPSSSSLEELFQDANMSILSESERKNRLMASTLVSAFIDKNSNEVTISNIGDSRAYIFTEDEIWHTKDDTLVQELIEMGIITEEQAFDHPNKNRLNKALGSIDEVQFNTIKTNLPVNSVLLLCTDGLHDYVRDEEIKEICMNQDPNNAVKSLIKKARKNGSTDDITLIIAQN